MAAPLRLCAFARNGLSHPGGGLAKAQRRKGREGETPATAKLKSR